MESKSKKLDFSKKQIQNLVRKIELIDKDIRELKEIKHKRDLTPLEMSFLRSLNETRKEEISELRNLIERTKK